MSLVACFTFLKLPSYVTFNFLIHSFFFLKKSMCFIPSIEADIFITNINPRLRYCKEHNFLC